MDSGENREAWIRAMDYWKEKAQYCMLDSQGGCSSMAGAIPAEVTFANQYFGNRPKIQSVEQDKSFASSVRERHMPRPEGGQDNPVLGLLQGVGSFSGANVEAANEYIKFLLQPEYFFDFLFLDPVHNAPILSEIANYQEYQQRLESMPDAWSQADLSAQLSEENYMPFPAETDPPNPYTGALFAAEPLWQLGYDVVSQGMDSGQAVDKAASALREVLSDAK
jgi:ABC-type glycerol-3-phosphate transport system substrate-binding protein